MTATPWGDAELLRSQKLSPGPGKSQQDVIAHQRMRLFSATVAVVAGKGYEATRVEDILLMAGVSRNAFYKHFSNKRDCFLATLAEIERLAEPAVVEVAARTSGTWDRKLAAMLDAVAEVVIAQPAMARVLWVEVYVAGPQAIEVVERIDRAIEDVVCRTIEESPDRAEMPRDVVRAAVGCVRKMIHTRLHEQRIDELPALMPELFAWMRGYRAPPEQLLRPRQMPPKLVTKRPEARDAGERILAAITDLVAEQGYPDTAITEIAARAGVSLTTFYNHFEGKETAFLAAQLSAQRQQLDATLPHFARATDWASAVAIAGHAFFAFLAVNPTIAQVAGVGTWASGAAALDGRARGMELFSKLLDEGFRQYPDTPPIAREAVGASIDVLRFSWLRREGAERLYELAPTAIFIVLAPFIGSERACELANAPFPGGA